MPELEHQEPDPGDIVRTAKRFKDVPSGGSLAGMHVNWVRGSFLALNPEEGAGGDQVAIDHQLVKLDINEPRRILIPGSSIAIVLTEGEWQLLNAYEQAIVLDVVAKLMSDPDMAAAIRHLEKEGVPSIRIHVGDRGMNYDGTQFDYKKMRMGKNLGCLSPMLLQMVRSGIQQT